MIFSSPSLLALRFLSYQQLHRVCPKKELALGPSGNALPTRHDVQAGFLRNSNAVLPRLPPGKHLYPIDASQPYQKPTMASLSLLLRACIQKNKDMKTREQGQEKQVSQSQTVPANPHDTSRPGPPKPQKQPINRPNPVS
ncbi:hypothetical protein NW755_004414 [Fusarium falciforme]|uniref:Uncharacterized protein n=1 Tax=Fusarium falciforme TaxID=195108 RepID=A0A9W8RA20_9HYPO|nr:hypothetical protein NW755_004414 [Fusarium falciforme]